MHETPTHMSLRYMFEYRTETQNISLNTVKIWVTDLISRCCCWSFISDISLSLVPFVVSFVKGEKRWLWIHQRLAYIACAYFCVFECIVAATAVSVFFHSFASFSSNWFETRKKVHVELHVCIDGFCLVSFDFTQRLVFHVFFFLVPSTSFTCPCKLPMFYVIPTNDPLSWQCVYLAGLHECLLCLYKW